jgi:ABC-type multidrug transport system ATPase subunit
MVAHMATLEIVSVTKTYSSEHRHTVALDDIDLALTRAESAAVEGEPEAGKSTLAAIVTGTIEPDTGAVRIDGRRPSPGEILPVADLGALFGPLSVRDAVATAVCLDGVRLRDGKARAVAVLDEFGLSDVAKISLGQLHHTERMRVAVCAALVREPAFIVADEPDAHLNGVDADAFISYLLEHAARANAGVLFTTRSVRSAAIADKQWWLRRGRATDVLAPSAPRLRSVS